MRFLLALSLGLFCTSLFGQEQVGKQEMPIRTLSADSSAAKSSGESGQSSVLSKQSPMSTAEVDAPSASKTTACTESNGKPCPQWVHKLIGPYPPTDVDERWNAQPDHFFTFGNARRVLHPDKKSWLLFGVAHAGMWAATVVAVRNHQTSQEEANSEYPAAAFMTAMDLLLFKTVSPALSVGPPVYAMAHYSRAAAK